MADVIFATVLIAAFVILAAIFYYTGRSRFLRGFMDRKENFERRLRRAETAAKTFRIGGDTLDKLARISREFQKIAPLTLESENIDWFEADERLHSLWEDLDDSADAMNKEIARVFLANVSSNVPH